MGMHDVFLDYSKSEVPKGYVCYRCQVTNCRLWISDCLLCANCLKATLAEDEVAMRASIELGLMGWIGQYIPAIPTDDLEGFWYPDGVPDAAQAWWRHLPERP